MLSVIIGVFLNNNKPIAIKFKRQGMTALENGVIEILPERILGMQRLEALFKEKGYLICQSSGEKIYDFEEIVAVFLPLSSSTDQVMTVRNDMATEFMHKCLLSIP